MQTLRKLRVAVAAHPAIDYPATEFPIHRRHIMDIYRFLSGDDDSSFCHKVTKALTEGWVLYGPPHYVFDPENKKMRCGQAVTKEVEDQPYDPDRKLTDYQ